MAIHKPGEHSKARPDEGGMDTASTPPTSQDEISEIERERAAAGIEPDKGKSPVADIANLPPD